MTYHDEEWGVPLHDDRALFELLTLEGAQAGLSWITVLKKREAYRKAFENFRVERVARFTEKKMAALMEDAGIIRNRLKIHATVKNARAILEVQTEFGSFDDFVWTFVQGRPIQNEWRGKSEVPVRTTESDGMSKALIQRGFTFVGSTICYAFMQASGMVNDHVVTCFRQGQLR